MVGRVKGKVGRDIGPNPIPLGVLHRMVWRGFWFLFPAFSPRPNVQGNHSDIFSYAFLW